MQSTSTAKNRGYNLEHISAQEFPWMAKQGEDFGQRLAQLRKDAGYTQTELGQEVGVSQRVIAYYEGETQYPPANLLPDLAKALNVTTDELLGIKSIKKNRQVKPDNRLQRRFQQIQKMGPKEKRQAIQLLDTIIEREQLKQAMKQS